MKKFNSIDEALASQDFDPAQVKITGVPEQHLKAVEAFVKLCVAHDAVNSEFVPDFSNSNQRKYSNYFYPGSPSGVGFSFDDCVRWNSDSGVGARLVSESSEASNHIAEICQNEYKNLMVYERKIK